MTTPTIAAIETHYAGCRFRSRLEARWAVVFDAKGLPWEYEPEGFETPCGRYLPDFRVQLLPTTPCWFEIKPSDYEIGESDMGRWIAVSRDTGLVLIIACGLNAATIVITPAHAYTHRGQPGFFAAKDINAGKAARFEFGEAGGR